MSEASERQLKAWVEGDPEHNDVDSECCPDFSCCRPDLLAPEHERRAFATADENVRMQMLGGFLGRAFASHGKKVHVAGQPREPDEKN